MRPFRPDPIIRISVPARDGGEPRQSPRQPHHPSTVEEARLLVEKSRLTLKEIGVKLGVSIASVSRWKDMHGWTRPPYSWPCRRRKAGRYVPVILGKVLATRLRMQAERLLSDLERAPAVDPAVLAEALRLQAEAREAQRVRRSRRRQPPPPVDASAGDGEKPRRKPSAAECSAVVERGWRTRYSRMEAHHRWMLQKIEK